jgi:hypothetical protein
MMQLLSDPSKASQFVRVVFDLLKGPWSRLFSIVGLVFIVDKKHKVWTLDWFSQKTAMKSQ